MGTSIPSSPVTTKSAPNIVHLADGDYKRECRPADSFEKVSRGNNLMTRTFSEPWQIERAKQFDKKPEMCELVPVGKPPQKTLKEQAINIGKSILHSPIDVYTAFEDIMNRGY